MFGPKEQIRNCLIAVKSQFFSRSTGWICKPGSFRKVTTLLMEKTKNEVRERRDPRLYKDQPAAGNQNARDLAQESHGRGEVMQHIQAENVSDAVRPKRELLCVGNGVEPGTPDKVRRDNVRGELFEKTGTSANLNGNSVLFSKGEQSREKFVVVDAPQNGFLFPNAAVPLKLLLSLRIDVHCGFFDCTEFGVPGRKKLAALFDCRYQKKTGARPRN